MGHQISHLEEKIAIGKLIEEAIGKIELPKGYEITTNSATIKYKPQDLLVCQIHSNRGTKGEYNTHIDLW